MKTVLSVGLPCLVIAGLVAAGLWNWVLHDTEGGMGVSAQGFAALAIGAVGTLGIAAGLAYLMVYSARHGYDEGRSRSDPGESGPEA